MLDWAILLKISSLYRQYINILDAEKLRKA
jgi:hypothetical protein